MTINQQPEQPVDYSGHVPGYGIDPMAAPVPAPAHVNQKVAKPVKQSRDRAQYTRQQKGHSFIMQWFVLGIFTMFIVPIYYAVSPNHYYHI